MKLAAGFYAVLAGAAWAQTRSSSVAATTSQSGSATITENAGVATQSYLSYNSTITLSPANGTRAAATTDAGSLIIGTAASTTSNATATSSGMPGVQDLVPCNGWPELCTRNYSNITFVGAHNSPFHILNNAGSNQLYGVLAQLNDGIRMLQGQAHIVDGQVRLCHTTCDLLDAGPAEDYFRNVSQWLAAAENRFEVVTILIGNGDYSKVTNYTAPIINSGLRQFAYVPPKIPMGRDDWPPLGELIALNKRAIIFMDYEANQTEVPYILDEFSQMWETPFDPTNDSFPCTVQRPPDLKKEDARNRLYMLNANLNVETTLLGAEVLLPNLVAINTTNGVSGTGSLGAATNGCVADWTMPPNFLLVDYYNYGSYPGSVFEVGARANGLNYTRGNCCGLDDQINEGSRAYLCPAMYLVVAAAAILMMF